MPRAAPAKTSFSAGEISPLLQGRTDLERYKDSVAECVNWIPTLQGGLVRRPGTFFVAEVKTSSKATRLVRFEFSITQAYVLEFGDQYIRFYRNQSQITSGGTAYEIVSPYLEADLFTLKFVQSADTLYIVSPHYYPRKLTRTAHTSWTLAVLSLSDGPYLPINTTATTITPSATSGNITLTASASLWVAEDATTPGRLVRIKHGSTWGVAQITGYTSATVVNATVRSNFGAATAQATWRLGLYTDRPSTETNSYPTCACFHEQRLVLAGAALAPQRLDMSVTSDFEDFEPHPTTSDTPAADNAVGITIDTDDVQVIRSVTSDEKGMIVLTTSGEHVVRAPSGDAAITPTSVVARQQGAFGSADIQPVKVGRGTLFVQRSKRKVRECAFDFYTDGFRSTDLSILAEHITAGVNNTGGNIKEMAFQREKQPILWCVLEDGGLVSLTYERDIEQLRAGWARHVLGGQSTAGGADPIVESVCAIPSTFGSYTEVWFVVRRIINGTTRRYVEFLTDIWESFFERDRAFYVDCGQQRTSLSTITNVTKVGSVVTITTSAAHGLSNGDNFSVDGVFGAADLNHKVFTAANITATTVELSGYDGTSLGTYSAGGRLARHATTFDFGNYLAGETVDILGDSAYQTAPFVSGATVLTHATGFISIGLHYDSDVKLLRFEAGAADGTAQGKFKTFNRLGLLVEATRGLRVGVDTFEDSKTDRVQIRKASHAMGFGPDLESGVITTVLDRGYNLDQQICIRCDQPYPATILSVLPQMTTEDGR